MERRVGQPTPSQGQTGGGILGGNPPPHIPRSPDTLAGAGMTERSLAFPPLQRLVGPGVPGPPGVRAAAPSRGRALRRMPQPPGSSRLHHE